MIIFGELIIKFHIMTTIIWTEALSVKIGSIDEQHKKLIDLINDFYNNIITHSAQEMMSDVIKALKDYTLYHFTAEENYMRQYGYTGFPGHKKEHDYFVAKVKDFEDRYNNGKLLISIEVTNFIKDWITNHIMRTDKLYSNFLIQKGVK